MIILTYVSTCIFSNRIKHFKLIESNALNLLKLNIVQIQNSIKKCIVNFFTTIAFWLPVLLASVPQQDLFSPENCL